MPTVKEKMLRLEVSYSIACRLNDGTLNCEAKNKTARNNQEAHVSAKNKTQETSLGLSLGRS